MLIFLGKRVTPSTSNRRLDVDGTFVNKQKAHFNGRKRAFLSPRCAGFKWYRVEELVAGRSETVSLTRAELRRHDRRKPPSHRRGPWRRASAIGWTPG